MRSAVRSGWWVVAALLVPAPAFAQQSVFGYQLGLTQSAGTTVGDVQVAVVQANPGAPVDQNQSIVSQSQGLQLTTTVNGNLTLDVATRTLNHAFLLGVGAAQLIPALVPEDEDGNVRQGVVANRTTTFNANFNYRGLLTRPRWAGTLGAGYAFGLNGLIAAGADGTVQGGNAQNNIPGQQLGALSFNGQTHTVNALLGVQLTPSFRWDASLNANYTYTRNGLFTVAAGALGAPQANGLGTNLGVFVPATVHNFAPTIQYRRRIGNNSQFDANALVTYTQAEAVDDSVTITGTTTRVFRAVQPPAPTLLNTLSLQYAYSFNDNRSLGLAAIGNLNFRVPTDQQGTVLTNASLATDTLIYTFRVFYTDLLPWELRLTAGLGAAQANLFQPPPGSPGDRDSFVTVRSNWEPVFDLSLMRRLDPVDVSLQAARTVQVGALGASAIVNENAALVFGYRGEFGEFRPALGVGVNVNRVRGAGADLFQSDPNNPIVVAFNNQGFGVNANLAIPIFEAAGFSFDFAATYNFTYVDTNPDDQPTLAPEPLATHTVIGTLRGIYGRGAAQAAAGVGGRTLEDELDAFTADPQSGSPLLSNQLLQAGNPLQVGRRVGQAPEARRDSRQAYQQQIQQQAREQKEREQSGVVQNVGTTQEEARRDAEAEAKAEEEKESQPPPPPPMPPPQETPPPPEPSVEDPN